MQNSILLVWLVSAMLRWTLPETQHEAATARYTEIAQDAVDVAFDPEEPPLFKGPNGKIETVALMLSIASYESSFSEDVDRGVMRGDGGRSWCLMQINVGKDRVLMTGDVYARGRDLGWSGPDLVEERQRCFRTGLHMMRESFRICRDLSLYTTGRCVKDEQTAKWRQLRAKNMIANYPAPGEDADFFSSVPTAMGAW